MTADGDTHRQASPPAIAPYDRLELGWLPQVDWTSRIAAAERLADPQQAWRALTALAGTRMDFIRTGRLDRLLMRHFAEAPPPGLSTKPVRLAVLGSSTLAQLLPAIRVAGLRRGLWISIYEADYGQYFQELSGRNQVRHQVPHQRDRAAVERRRPRRPHRRPRLMRPALSGPALSGR